VGGFWGGGERRKQERNTGGVSKEFLEGKSKKTRWERTKKGPRKKPFERPGVALKSFSVKTKHGSGAKITFKGAWEK